MRLLIIQPATDPDGWIINPGCGEILEKECLTLEGLLLMGAGYLTFEFNYFKEKYNMTILESLRSYAPVQATPEQPNG